MFVYVYVCLYIYQIIRKALEKANETALKMIEEEKIKEKETERLGIRLNIECMDRENIEGRYIFCMQVCDVCMYVCMYVCMQYWVVHLNIESVTERMKIRLDIECMDQENMEGRYIFCMQVCDVCKGVCVCKYVVPGSTLQY